MTWILLACGRGSHEPPPDGDGDTTTDSAQSAAPVDADGDGSAADVDCDDADPARHPGADDPCDGVDQDCDGLTAGEGRCSEVFLVDDESAAGWWEGDGEGGHLGLLPSGGTHTPGRDTDFDQDGVDDVSGQMSGTLLLRGGIPSPGRPALSVDTLGYWPETSGFGTAGDFDGDGSTDIFATYLEDGAEELYEGRVYLLLGPSFRWTTDWTPLADVADGAWEHNDPDESFGWQTDGADVDGDGLSDVVVWSGTASTDPDAPGGYFRVIRGRAPPLPMGVAIEDEEPWYTADIDVYGGEMKVLPDIDGDGVQDVSFMVRRNDENFDNADTIALLPTEVLTPAYSEQDVTDLWEVIPKGDDVRSVYALEEPSALGDVDGDGYGDVALMAYDSMPEVYREDVVCLGILHGGADLPASTVSDQLGGRVCTQEHFADAGESSTSLGSPRVVQDSDGDAIPDLFLPSLYQDSTDDDSSIVSCVVPTAQLPSAGAVHIDEVHKFCFATETWDGYKAVQDLDGDGRPELLATEYYWGDQEQGRILVVPGFDIPWDDPTRW